MRKVPMKRVTHTVTVFKAGARNADGKRGEELSLCRCRTSVRPWWHEKRLCGFVLCLEDPGTLVTRGVSGCKVVASWARGSP